MKLKENRKMKVYYAMEERVDQHSYYANSKRYISVPHIRLQGLWLEQCGFAPGTPINVHCENGKLIITTDNAEAN